MWFADYGLWVAWISHAPTYVVDPQFEGRIAD